MNTPTLSTDDLILRLTDQHKAAGTSVRCPKCGAGQGKFCRSSEGNLVIHIERQRAAA